MENIDAKVDILAELILGERKRDLELTTRACRILDPWWNLMSTRLWGTDTHLGHWRRQKEANLTRMEFWYDYIQVDRFPFGFCVGKGQRGLALTGRLVWLAHFRGRDGEEKYVGTPGQLGCEWLWTKKMQVAIAQPPNDSLGGAREHVQWLLKYGPFDERVLDRCIEWIQLRPMMLSHGLSAWERWMEKEGVGELQRLSLVQGFQGFHGGCELREPTQSNVGVEGCKGKSYRTPVVGARRCSTCTCS